MLNPHYKALTWWDTPPEETFDPNCNLNSLPYVFLSLYKLAFSICYLGFHPWRSTVPGIVFKVCPLVMSALTIVMANVSIPVFLGFGVCIRFCYCFHPPYYWGLLDWGRKDTRPSFGTKRFVKCYPVWHIFYSNLIHIILKCSVRFFISWSKLWHLLIRMLSGSPTPFIFLLLL